MRNEWIVASLIESQCDNIRVVKLHVEDNFTNDDIFDISLHPSKNNCSIDVQLYPMWINDTSVMSVTERSKTKKKAI